MDIDKIIYEEMKRECQLLGVHFDPTDLPIGFHVPMSIKVPTAARHLKRVLNLQETDVLTYAGEGTIVVYTK